MDDLRNTIHQQSISLLKTEGDNQRLRSELRLAKIETNPIVAGI
jgi:hypothetical protein